MKALLTEKFHTLTFPVEAVQTTFPLTHEQNLVYDFLLKLADSHLHRIAYFMGLNSTDNLFYRQPDNLISVLQGISYPIFIFLLNKMSSNTEELIVLAGEGQKRTKAVLHSELIATSQYEALLARANQNLSLQVCRSGHMRGTLVMLDYLQTSKYHKTLAMEAKLELALMRNGFVPIGADGTIAQRDIVEKLLAKE